MQRIINLDVLAGVNVLETAQAEIAVDTSLSSRSNPKWQGNAPCFTDRPDRPPICLTLSRHQALTFCRCCADSTSQSMPPLTSSIPSFLVHALFVAVAFLIAEHSGGHPVYAIVH